MYPYIARGSTHETNLNKIHLKQKHAIRRKCCKNKFTHTKSLMLSGTYGDVSNTFVNKFTNPSHRYPTNFSKKNFVLPKYLSQ